MSIWSEELTELVISLYKEGKNCTEISDIINNIKSPISINKKLNRLGYKYGRSFIGKKRQEKFYNIKWNEVQKEYDEGVGYRGIIKIFKLSTNSISWAKENNLLKLKTNSDGLKKAWEIGKYPKSDLDGIMRYRKLCKFEFNVYNYPNEFNLNLVKEYGWYKAKNMGDNPNGVSKDHKYSIKKGFVNNISPEILSHPANCILVLQKYNSSKNSKCSISLDELKQEIINWDKKYGVFDSKNISYRLSENNFSNDETELDKQNKKITRQQYLNDVRELNYNTKHYKRIELIINSNIEFNKRGWVNEVSKLINIKSQKVKNWMIKFMPCFYSEKCLKRKIKNEQEM